MDNVVLLKAICFGFTMGCVFLGLFCSIFIIIFFDRKLYHPYPDLWSDPEENATGYDPFGIMMRVVLYNLVFFIPRVRKNYKKLYILMKKKLNKFEIFLLKMYFTCMCVVGIMGFVPQTLARIINFPESVKDFLFLPDPTFEVFSFVS